MLSSHNGNKKKKKEGGSRRRWACSTCRYLWVKAIKLHKYLIKKVDKINDQLWVKCDLSPPALHIPACLLRGIPRSASLCSSLGSVSVSASQLTASAFLLLFLCCSCRGEEGAEAGAGAGNRSVRHALQMSSI